MRHLPICFTMSVTRVHQSKYECCVEQHYVGLLYSTEWSQTRRCSLLFAVYIDELMRKLKQSGYCCTIGHIYCGAFVVHLWLETNACNLSGIC